MSVIDKRYQLSRMVKKSYLARAVHGTVDTTMNKLVDKTLGGVMLDQCGTLDNLWGN